MNPLIHHLNDINDPRLAPYRALKDRDIARNGDLFIAESEHIVRRLLDSDYPVQSVLLAERRVEEMAPIIPPHIPIYVVGDNTIHQVIGYKFHSGVIACGQRKAAASLDALLSVRDRLTLMICPEIANSENLGSLIRISAAFGVDGMILGEHSCDPFWRQSIRVSMGTVFRLPIFRSQHLLDDLGWLKDEWGIELAATVLDEKAEPLKNAKRGLRFGLLFGNEAQGLRDLHIAACDRRITIPMRLGTDSLNVAVAAGIFLHHFTG